jgi:tyrosinase
MAIRQNISSLRPEQLSQLRRAHKLTMDRIDNRSYFYMASVHGWLEEWCEHEPIDDPANPARMLHLFLPWHRAYCYTLESNFQTVLRLDGDPKWRDFALPYWNWRSTRSQGGSEPIPPAYLEPTAGGQPNPLHHYRMVFSGRTRSDTLVNVNEDTRREPGTWFGARSLAHIRQRTSQQGEDIPQVLRQAAFTEFSERLRNGWHNLIHMYVGGNQGHFSDPDLAAYDPIFWPHHVQIDRVWRIWQREHGAENMPEYMKDIPLSPFGRLRVRDVMSVSNLGYDYARVTGEA